MQDDCLATNHKISAREAYLRASNYYRVAEFLLINSEDPRIQITWESSKKCFSNANKLFSPPTIEEGTEERRALSMWCSCYFKSTYF
jgi:hypothetical protein